MDGKQPEKKIQKEIIKYLEGKGYYVVKVVVANKSGVPDILFCKDGKFCAIEVKATGKKKNVTELQKLHLKMIRDSGGTAIVSDSLEEVKDTFKG
jgi:Holliday junction resolvase